MVKRANPLKILMLLLIPALGALSPAAYGRPAKAAVHAVAKKPAAHGAKGNAAARVAAKPAKGKVVRESAKGGKAHASAKRGETRGAQAESSMGRGRGRSGKAAKAEVAYGTRAKAKTKLRGRALRAEEAREAREEQAQARSRGSSRGRAKVKTPEALQARNVPSESKGVGVAPQSVAARPVPAPPATAAEVPAASSDGPAVKHDRKHHLQAAPVPSTTSAPVPPGHVGDVSLLDPSKALQPAFTASLSNSTEASAVLFTKGGRLIMPPAMKGSHDILIHQNVMADQDGLERVQDDEDLNRMRGAKTLLPLPENASLATDDRLPVNRRFARPWTVKFLEAVAKAHYERFHSALQVNSAVRTVEFQRNLMRVNGNAAPAGGETASPHLTGQAVDLAKKGLSLTEIAWLRGYLLPLVQQGKIDVEEEFQQSCFHISVYRKYLPEVAPRREIGNRPGTGSAIAAAMR